MNCTALMVAIENGEEVFITVDMDLGGEAPPENNPTDIRRCVDLFNRSNTDDWTYIDMFGIIKNGRTEKWEIVDV